MFTEQLSGDSHDPTSRTDPWGIWKRMSKIRSQQQNISAPTIWYSFDEEDVTLFLNILLVKYFQMMLIYKINIFRNN